MTKAIARRYTSHLDYDTPLDIELLNMKIRIIDEDFHNNGNVYYSGTVHEFIKERIPVEALVKHIPELKRKDKVPYSYKGGINYIERLR